MGDSDGLWYDKQGRRISLEQWLMLRRLPDYQHVALTDVGPYVVSTVWLGLDHGFGSGAPLIFESMVFRRDDWEAPMRNEDGTLKGTLKGLYRYATEAEALAGHEAMVTLLRATGAEDEGPVPRQQPWPHGEL